MDVLVGRAPDWRPSPWGNLRLMGVLLVLASVPVLWPELDLWVAGLLYGEHARLHAGEWAWVVWMNDYVPTVGRKFVLAGLVLAVALGLLRSRMQDTGMAVARVSLFVSMGLLLGPGLAVLWVKDWWLRARPREVLPFGGDMDFTPALTFADQCTTNCSFVSGHAATGFFLATLYVLGGRWRWWFFAAGTVLGGLVSFARMAVGAHWLSDVLWAFVFTMLVSAWVWYVLERLNRWLVSRN